MIKPARILFFGQLVFFLGILVCTILLPRFLFASDQGGISNFGTYGSTVIPFTISFIGVGSSLVVAGMTLRTDTNELRTARRILIGLGVLTLLTAGSTYAYRITGVLHTLHLAVSQLLFVAEIPSSLWFWSVARGSRVVTALFRLYLIGIIVSLLAISGIFRVLFVAEVLSSVSLGCMLAFALQELSVSDTQAK